MIAAHRGKPLRKLDGAFPAATFAEESSMLRFYADVDRGLARVRRDGDPRRLRR